jgi:hypothetical protein
VDDASRQRFRTVTVLDMPSALAAPLPSERPRYDRYSPYDDVYNDNVVAPARWAR